MLWAIRMVESVNFELSNSRYLVILRLSWEEAWYAPSGLISSLLLSRHEGLSLMEGSNVFSALTASVHFSMVYMQGVCD